MSQLLDITATIRIQLEDRAIHREHRDFPHVDGFFQSPVEHSRSQGIPRLSVDSNEVSHLHNIAGFYLLISAIFSVFPASRTLRRRRHESGTFSDFAFSSMPDNQLDSIVRETLEITPYLAEDYASKEEELNHL